MGSKLIPIEQKRLVVSCNSYDEFKAKFIEKFSSSVDPMKLGSRVYNLWYFRERHAKEVAEHDRIQHTVMIPAQIRKPALASSLKPDDDMQVKIYNQLLYIGQLLKEQNELFNKLASKDTIPKGE